MATYFMLINAWVQGYNPFVWLENTWRLYAPGVEILYIIFCLGLGFMIVISGFCYDYLESIRDQEKEARYYGERNKV